MVIHYKFNQFDVFKKYIDGELVDTFKIGDEKYVTSFLNDMNNNGATSEFIDEPNGNFIDELKAQAVDRLRDRLQEFVNIFTRRFPESELQSFPEKVKQALDYELNGANTYNSPISIEANIIGLTPTQLVNVIKNLAEQQRQLMPFVSGIRQVTHKKINLAQSHEDISVIFNELEGILKAQGG